METESGVGKRAIRRVTSLFVLCMVIVLAAPILAETVVFVRRPLPLSAGLALEYDTNQQKPRQDTFKSKVRVVTVEKGLRQEPSRVTFRWQIVDRARTHSQNEAGQITTTGIPDGRSYDPWWKNGQDIVTSNSHLWLSQSACEELKLTGETKFAVSVTHRGDEPMTLSLVGMVSFDTRIHGHLTSLTAFEVKSEKQDLLTVLADCTNPLVLEAKMPGIQQWRLMNARTHRGKRYSWR